MKVSKRDLLQFLCTNDKVLDPQGPRNCNAKGCRRTLACALRTPTKKTNAKLAIPVHPELLAILDAVPGQHLTYLTTHGGSPFSPAGFGNLFRKWCNEASLPKGLSAHGLRKACCTRLAEAGCSEKQIAAISGHLSMSEVGRYTKAADQARLARDAMAMFSSTRTSDCQTSIQSVKLASNALKGQGEN